METSENEYVDTMIDILNDIDDFDVSRLETFIMNNKNIIQKNKALTKELIMKLKDLDSSELFSIFDIEYYPFIVSLGVELDFLALCKIFNIDIVNNTFNIRRYTYDDARHSLQILKQTLVISNMTIQYYPDELFKRVCMMPSNILKRELMLLLMKRQSLTYTLFSFDYYKDDKFLIMLYYDIHSFKTDVLYIINHNPSRNILIPKRYVRLINKAIAYNSFVYRDEYYSDDSIGYTQQSWTEVKPFKSEVRNDIISNLPRNREDLLVLLRYQRLYGSLTKENLFNNIEDDRELEALYSDYVYNTYMPRDIERIIFQFI